MIRDLVLKLNPTKVKRIGREPLLFKTARLRQGVGELVQKRGLLFYSWAQGPLDAGDNRKLHVALHERAPIILFEKPMANLYVPVFPVYVIDVLPDERTFVIDLDESGMRPSPMATLDKRYVERLVKQRVHQPVFRARVLSAYNKRCAICT